MNGFMVFFSVIAGLAFTHSTSGRTTLKKHSRLAPIHPAMLVKPRSKSVLAVGDSLSGSALQHRSNENWFLRQPVRAGPGRAVDRDDPYHVYLGMAGRTSDRARLSPYQDQSAVDTVQFRHAPRMDRPEPVRPR
jgi:hypothetical protein